MTLDMYIRDMAESYARKELEESKFEMVKKMLAMNMSIDDISKISDWSKEKILQVLNKQDKTE